MTVGWLWVYKYSIYYSTRLHGNYVYFITSLDGLLFSNAQVRALRSYRSSPASRSYPPVANNSRPSTHAYCFSYSSLNSPISMPHIRLRFCSRTHSRLIPPARPPAVWARPLPRQALLLSRSLVVPWPEFMFNVHILVVVTSSLNLFLERSQQILGSGLDMLVAPSSSISSLYVRLQGEQSPAGRTWSARRTSRDARLSDLRAAWRWAQVRWCDSQFGAFLLLWLIISFG